MEKENPATMPDLAQKIRSALDEYDRDKDREDLEARLGRIESNAGRDFTKDDLKTILRNLNDDDRDELVEALVGPERFERIREPSREPASREEDAESDDDPSPPARRTRPGRKTGMAYQWDVDDEGNVVELDVARVYSGDDEDDEVELPPEESDE